jgi:uncharacterized protein (UPF0333 family)
MRKAQGALEYLIIIAAVLAIAAIVVLFLTGAFKGATGGGDIAKCRLAASTCASNVASGVYGTVASCQGPCIAACANSAGKDVMAPTVTISGATCPAGALACIACALGNTTGISG